MMTPAQKQIFAFVDRLQEETGDAVFLNVGREFVHGMRAVATLRWVAELRSGDARGRSCPLFVEDGEQNLRATGATAEEAMERLAALCA